MPYIGPILSNHYYNYINLLDNKWRCTDKITVIQNNDILLLSNNDKEDEIWTKIILPEKSKLVIGGIFTKGNNTDLNIYISKEDDEYWEYLTTIKSGEMRINIEIDLSKYSGCNYIKISSNNYITKLRRLEAVITSIKIIYEK